MESINIGLLSAMPEEIGTTIENLENVTLSEYGDLKFIMENLRKKFQLTNLDITIGPERMG